MTTDEQTQRRLFISVQAAKAAVGAVLSLAFLSLVGRPDAAETVAIAGLMAPALLAVLGFMRIRLSILEQAGLATFAILIGYLAALTGGMTSPLIVWFALVPAEAALAGGRPAVLRAGMAAGLALLTVVGIEAVGALPPSRLTLPLWQIYAVSVLAALLQAVLIAAAAQDRQRAADLAAAEGAAMYRFLADHAMDLITRHSSDGRIRFASPASNALLGAPAGRDAGPCPADPGACRRPEGVAGSAGGIFLFRPRGGSRSAAAPSGRPLGVGGDALPSGGEWPWRLGRHRGGDARHHRAQGA